MEKIMNYFPPNPNGKIYYTELFKTFNKTPFNIKSRKFKRIKVDFKRKELSIINWIG